MKKNGFTLIELLAVLVILAIIAVITTISVDSILHESKNNLSNVQKKKIESAAETFYLKEGMNNKRTCVNVSELSQKGYLEGTSVKDPKDKTELNGSIEISYAANKYSYTYQESTCSVPACTIERQNEGVYTIGDVVTCELEESTDKFYVIEDAEGDAKSINVLTEYAIDPLSKRQSSNAQDTDFSTKTYWLDENQRLLSKYGESYPADIYSDDNDIIKPIVDDYVSYLNTKLVGTTGSLLTYNQITKFGCFNDLEFCSSAPSWLYNPGDYYLGTASESHFIWWLDSMGYIYYGATHENNALKARPVITISTDDIE